MTALRAVETSANAQTLELKRFLCERYWLPATDYPLCPDVFHALGLKGDDCHEFMTDFAEIFQVDLTEYVWPNYHLAEDEALDVRAALRPLMRFAGLKTQPLNRDLIPISIEHLQKVALLGRWFDAEVEEDLPLEGGIGRSIARFSSRLKAGGVPRIRSR